MLISKCTSVIQCWFKVEEQVIISSLTWEEKGNPECVSHGTIANCSHCMPVMYTDTECVCHEVDFTQNDPWMNRPELIWSKLYQLCSSQKVSAFAALCSPAGWQEIQHCIYPPCWVAEKNAPFVIWAYIIHTRTHRQTHKYTQTNTHASLAKVSSVRGVECERKRSHAWSFISSERSSKTVCDV